MTALSSSIARKSLGHGPVAATFLPLPLAASAKVYQGSLCAIDTSGYLVAASADNSLRIVGVSTEEKDNTSGSAGALSALVKRGPFYFKNSSSTDAITLADVGRVCFVVDDNTVARTSSAGARPVAGKVIGVDSTDGVLVEVGAEDAAGELDFLALAGEALTSKQFHFVDLNSSAAAVAVAAEGARSVGVLQNAPANGAVAIIRPIGCGRTSKLISGGSVTAGDTVASNNAGRAKTAVTGRVNTSDAGASNDPVSGSFTGGVALSTGASNGNTIQVLLIPTSVAPQTAA